MMKFTMDAKELKAMLDKVMTAINKKSKLDCFRKIYVQVDNAGIVRVLGTDIEHHYVEIRSINAYDTNIGDIGIDIDDVKVITKMSGEITLEDGGLNKSINVKCGKKIVSIPRYENIDTFLPSMDDTETHILTLNESWLLETVTNLYPFTTDEKGNEMLEVFNFNTLYERVEAIDSYRIGIRSLSKQKIITKMKSKCDEDSVKLNRRCVPVFKKIMDKKSDAEIKVYQDKKYVRVEGNDFTYIIKRKDGGYYDTEKMLSNDYKYTFNADRESMLSVMKYNCDLARQVKVPTVFHSENGKLFSYMTTSKYEAFDELKVDNNKMDERLYIAFNHYFLVDVLSVIDEENPVFMMSNAKAPMFIKGNEYSFILLPVYLDGMDQKMKQYMSGNKVA